MTDELLQAVAYEMDGASIFHLVLGGDGSEIFFGSQPPRPDVCVTLYPRPSPRPSLRPPLEVRTVQCLVRGTQDIRVAAVKAEAIYTLLHGLREFSVPLVELVLARATTAGPVHLGRDDKGRHEFSIEFEIYIRNFNRR